MIGNWCYLLWRDVTACLRATGTECRMTQKILWNECWWFILTSESLLSRHWTIRGSQTLKKMWTRVSKLLQGISFQDNTFLNNFSFFIIEFFSIWVVESISCRVVIQISPARLGWEDSKAALLLIKCVNRGMKFSLKHILRFCCSDIATSAPGYSVFVRCLNQSQIGWTKLFTIKIQ